MVWCDVGEWVGEWCGWVSGVGGVVWVSGLVRVSGWVGEWFGWCG